MTTNKQSCSVIVWYTKQVGPLGTRNIILWSLENNILRIATLNLKYYIVTDRLIIYLKMQFGNQQKSELVHGKNQTRNCFNKWMRKTFTELFGLLFYVQMKIDMTLIYKFK